LPAWSEFIKEAVTLRPELGGRNFECPEGIRFVEIDADHGAISTVACPHRELIAVTDRLAPNLECLAHGVAVEDNVLADGADNSAENDVTQHVAKSRLHDVRLSGSSTTRVAMDQQGRRTLTNRLP
ncbi:MAG TPA: hypothetical protein VJV03_17155, partial [Pyrinomonadaceae bacterium]|nr:hypothetical protein [Pyrinomonadaceae bacterium]